MCGRMDADVYALARRRSDHLPVSRLETRRHGRRALQPNGALDRVLVSPEFVQHVA